MASGGQHDDRQDPRDDSVSGDRNSTHDTLPAFPGLVGGPPEPPGLVARKNEEAELERALAAPAVDPRPAPFATPGPPAQMRWLLESVVDGARELRRMLIHPLPFRIGRVPGLDLVLPSQLVSKAHAEIYAEAGVLRLRDLNSTNGTFVNRSRIQDVVITEGDVLHFGDFEFRVGREERDDTRLAAEDGHATASFGNRPLPGRLAMGTRELKEMLFQGWVGIVFQPIMRLPEGEIVAYEALGRGHHPLLPENPSILFRIAESVGLATELSRLFRRRTVELVRHRKDLPALFLNTHPSELEQPGLAESLEEVRELAPQLKLILEIHESALAVPGAISALRARLDRIDVGLAYDDFGAGQARLIELAEAPPHFLKFDRRFVAEIDQALASKQLLLASLVTAARELLVETIAEGVATAAELEVVTRVGFTHAQGFLLGRPIPSEQI